MIISGWWFGTFVSIYWWLTLWVGLLDSDNDWLVVWNVTLIFPFRWEFHHPDWLIFFRWVETTNQMGWNHQTISNIFNLIWFTVGKNGFTLRLNLTNTSGIIINISCKIEGIGSCNWTSKHWIQPNMIWGYHEDGYLATSDSYWRGIVEVIESRARIPQVSILVAKFPINQWLAWFFQQPPKLW